MVCTGAWAQSPTYLVRVSTIENPVEYNIANGGQKWLGSSRFATDATDAANTDKTLGRFIFIEKEDRDGSVYIYDTRNQKYLSWTSDASSANNNTRTASTSYVQYKDKADAKTWWITTGNVPGSYYVRTSSTTTNNKWNYCGGAGYVLNLFTDSDTSASWYFVLAPKENTKYMIRNERSDQSVWYLKADRLHTANSNEAGLFTFESKGDGSYYIKNESNGYLYSTNNATADDNHRTSATAYIQYTQTKQSATSWYITKNGANSETSSYFDVRPTLVFTDNTPAWNFTGGGASHPLNYWTAGDGSSQWTFEEFVDWVGLETIIEEANTYPYGDGLGQYSNPDFGSVKSEATIMLTLHKNNAAHADAEHVAEAINNLRAEIDKLALNMPKNGAFLRMKGVENTTRCLLNTTSNNKYGMGIDDTKSIFYFDGHHLLSYANGIYFGAASDSWDWTAVGGTGSEIEFMDCSTRSAYLLRIPCNDARYSHCFLYSGTSTSTNADRGALNGKTTDAKYHWTLEEVKKLPVTLTTIDEHSYATFYAPVAVTLPEGVKAYAVTIDGEKAVMEDVGEVVPANTGVVLFSSTGVTAANLNIGGEPSYGESNVLEGTAATINTSAGANLTMQNGSNGIGFYNYTGNTLKGFKAYLPKENIPSGVSGFVFNFNEEATTAVVNAIAAQSAGATFDLTGRQIRANAKGISIVNGNKVIR